MLTTCEARPDLNGALFLALRRQNSIGRLSLNRNDRKKREWKAEKGAQIILQFSGGSCCCIFLIASYRIHCLIEFFQF